MVNYSVYSALGGAGPSSAQVTVGQLLLYADEAVPQLTEEHTGQLQFPQLFLPPQDFPIGVR